MLTKLEDLRIQAQNIDHEIAGSLTVGTYDSLAEYLWPDFIITLKEKYPHLHLSIRTSQRVNPIEDLFNGKIELLVDAEPGLKEGLISWPLYSDYFGFYVANDFSNIHLTKENLLKQTVMFVQQATDENGFTIIDHLDKLNLKFAHQYSFDSFSTVKRFAIKKLGIAVLPRHLAREDEEAKLIKRISLSGVSSVGFGKHTICATTLIENQKEVRIRKIISMLKTHFK